MNPVSRGFGVVALLVGFAACTSTTPSEGLLEDLVDDSYQVEGVDRFVEVRDLMLLDSHAPSQDRYVADVSYDLVFVRGAGDIAGGVAERLADAFGEGHVEGDTLRLPAEAAVRIFNMDLLPWEKGERRHVERTLTLERWESGWRLVE